GHESLRREAPNVLACFPVDGPDALVLAAGDDQGVRSGYRAGKCVGRTGRLEFPDDLRLFPVYRQHFAARHGADVKLIAYYSCRRADRAPYLDLINFFAFAEIKYMKHAVAPGSKGSIPRDRGRPHDRPAGNLVFPDFFAIFRNTVQMFVTRAEEDRVAAE